jgi:hypothetical protein
MLRVREGENNRRGRKLHNDELHDLCSSPDIIIIIIIIVVAAQDQAISTNYFKNKILKK